MKKYIWTIAILLNTILSYGTIRIVDQNGAGNFISIQAAIDAASINDTVRVWPGVYMEQINLYKNILLEGSGYENTTLTGNFGSTVNISAGKIRWFKISSLRGNGVVISAGVIANCVIKSCPGIGIYGFLSTTGLVINCIMLENGSYAGSYADGKVITILNCISRDNNSNGYSGATNPANLNISYSDGSIYNGSNRIGCIDLDPLFVDALNEDFHLSSTSPCLDKGQPTIKDPDGTRSDMGYFGGPDCPIFPVVYNVSPVPNNGKINIKANAKANY